MLIRRVVPAIAATLAAYAGLALAAGLFLRQHYMTPLVTSKLNLPGSAWIMSQWWTKGGKFAFAGHRRPSTCSPAAVLPRRRSGQPQAVAGDTRRSASPSTATPSGPAISPASRFWPFQWIEGGWLLALSVLLIAATVWLVRRRAA